MIRPFAFGIRLHDKQRTVRVRHNERNPGRYVVEDSRPGGKTRMREHASLTGALQDLASTWRKRLH